MAAPLGYTPPSPDHDQARDELDDLVTALHDSGLLRALAGAARSYPDLLRPLLRAVDARTVRAVIALSAALADLDPDGADRLATGVRRARRAATDAADRPPGGVRALWRQVRDPDTRRGVAVVLAGLAAVGGALQRPDEDADSGQGAS